MKVITAFLLIFVAVSCVSKKYNYVHDQNNFSNIQAGSKYTVYDKNNRKIFLNVTSVESDSIKGMRKNQPLAIAKSDIKEIKKNRNGATFALISSGIVVIGGTALLVSAMKSGLDTFGKIVGDIH